MHRPYFFDVEQEKCHEQNILFFTADNVHIIMLNKLESLPNEILIEILSYITCVDAVLLFSSLNSRFRNLLIEFCRIFDFTSISKKNFDTIFQYQNTDKWHSLKISDAKHTPGQVTYFFEHHELNRKFSKLQSLSIVNVILYHPCPLFSQLASLSNLVSLELESLCGNNIPEFELPNLKELTFSSCPNTAWVKVNRQLKFTELPRIIIFHFYRI